jgi:RHS repeat-associated protein
MSRSGGSFAHAFRGRLPSRHKLIIASSAVTCALVASIVSPVVVPPALADARPQVAPVPSIPHANVQVSRVSPPAAPPTVARSMAKSWPTAGDADVTVGASGSLTANTATVRMQRSGSLPILVGGASTDGKAAPNLAGTEKVHVHLADQKTATKAGVSGVVFTVAPDGSLNRPLSVGVDYSAFRDAIGGDYADRLHLVKLPACALTTPDKPECRTQTPVPGAANDSKSGLVSGSVAPDTAQSRVAGAASAPMVLAATSGPAGSNGTFSASSLAPSGTWSAGGSSGAFSWSYPIAVPPAAAGGSVAPKVSLSYSSSSVDGRTAGTNNQSSWIGEGWDYTPGYVERTYRSCNDDPSGKAAKDYDLCWAGQIVTMSLGGSSVSLVQDDNTKQWHASSDTGDRIELLTDSNNGNGARNGEYWKVTTPDGVQYFFGRNGGPGRNGQAGTDSTWTEPVYGLNPSDPCYSAAGFASSSCSQAWRWNLDYVEDPHGNATMYYYTKETSYYGAANKTTPVAYVRGGELARIDYGLRDVNKNGANTVYGSPAPDQVVFTPAVRCFPATATECDESKLSKDNASSWKDTPADQLCKSDPNTPCDNHSPSMWSTKRLDSITTQYYNGSGYTVVDSYAMGQDFSDSGDASLRLNQITRTAHGSDGSTITVPPIKFTGQMLDNRVLNYNTQPAMSRWRLTSITTETGEIISVSYTQPDCTATNVPAAPENDTKLCYPVHWTLPYDTKSTLDYFHKYLVHEVDVQGAVSLSPTQRTAYNYVGSPAWHYDDNEVTKPVDRTYGQFRGYQKVEVRTGDPANVSNGAHDQQTLTATTYYRGMDGDTLPNNGKRTGVVVSDSLGENVTDSDQFAGNPREVQTFNGDGGAQLSTKITDPMVVGTSASRNRAGLPALTAYILGTAKTRSITNLAAGGVSTATTTDTYDSVGRVVEETSSADGLPDLCTSTTYAEDTTAWIRNLPSEVITSQQVCPTPGTKPSPILSDVRSYYDGQTTLGAVQGHGDITHTDNAVTNNNGNLTFINAGSKTYDSSGRPVSVTDADNQTSTTDFTPAERGNLTQSVLTNAKGQKTTTAIEPGRGGVTAVVDVAGHRSDASYDALGRVVAVWKPGHSKAGNQQPSVTYDYLVRSDGALALTTKTLVDISTSTNYVTTISLYDSLGQLIQTQGDAEGGGRVVSDTFYDSHGWATRSNNKYLTAGGPSTTLISVADKDVNDRTVTTYDGSGRALVNTDYNGPTETWHTRTVYGGDRTTVIPPTGSIATTALADARGRTTELRQYTTQPTINGSVVTGGAYQATKYEYTSTGAQSKIADPVGSVWTSDYDLLGRKTTQRDPDAGTETYAYDAAGLVSSQTDARGQTLAYTYDELGRKTAEYKDSTNGTQLASWTYDTKQAGKLSFSTTYTPNGNYSVGVSTYDDMGNPGKVFAQIPASEGALQGTYFTQYSWTTTGLAIGAQPADGGGLPGEVIGTTYDPLGNPLTTRSSSGAYVTDTKYTPLGEVGQLTLGSSDHPSWLTYNRDDQTRRVTESNFSTQQAATQQLDDTRYTYDPAGNITSTTDIQGANTAPVERQCFSYDALARLHQAWSATTDCSAAPSNTAGSANIGGPYPYWTTWEFRADSMRASEVDHALPGAAGGDTTTSYVYPSAGTAQPHTLLGTSTTGPGGTKNASYTYDATGSTTGRSLPDGSQTLTWDPEGKLATDKTAAGVTSYVYDASGNELVRHDPDTTTLYLPGEELVRNNATGAVTGTRYYAHGASTVAVRVGNADPQYLSGADQHGTEQISYEPYSNKVARRQFDVYGNAMGSGTGLWPDSHGFLNKPLDQNTKLTDVGAREYDATIGRFISVDPVFEANNPALLNGYTYTAENPVSSSDPSGQMPHCPDGDCSHGLNGVAGQKDVTSMSPVYGTPGWDNFCQPDCKTWGTSSAYHLAGSVNVSTAPNGTKLLNGVPVPPRAPAGFLRLVAQEIEQSDNELGYDREYFGYDMVVLMEAACEHRMQDACEEGGSGALIYNFLGMEGDYAAAEGLMFGNDSAGGGHEMAGLRARATSVSKSMKLDSGEGVDESTLRNSIFCSLVPHSFVGSTPVLMADGTSKPIDQVEVGNQVLSADPSGSGDPEAHVVTALHVTDDDREFVDVAVTTGSGVQTITATVTHPFWDKTSNTWTPAVDLKAGDRLDAPGRADLVVASINIRVMEVRTYDLTVDGLHTYYVLAGNTPVLVHNACGNSAHADDCYCNWGEPVVERPGATAPAADEFTGHAMQRLEQRGVSQEDAQAVLQRTPFSYYHDDQWKLGYYDPGSKVFVAKTVDGNVNTVMTNVDQSYINRLQGGR